MACDRCGAAALKTVWWRDRNGGVFTLCDACHAPIAGAVWIIPGPIVCFGICHQCGEWVSIRDLRDAKPGGRRSAPAGTCVTYELEVRPCA